MFPDANTSFIKRQISAIKRLRFAEARDFVSFKYSTRLGGRFTELALLLCDRTIDTDLRQAFQLGRGT